MRKLISIYSNISTISTSTQDRSFIWHHIGKKKTNQNQAFLQNEHQCKQFIPRFCHVIFVACIFYIPVGHAASLAESLLWRKRSFSSRSLCLQQVVSQDLLRSASWFYIYIWSGFIFNQPRLCSFSTSHFETDAFSLIKDSFCSTV